AALLGTVAGIGFIWMATQGVFDVFSDPIIGLPILFVAMVGVFGGYLFKDKFQPLVVAIVGGIIYSLLLGRTHVDFSGVGFYIPNPTTAIQGIINGFAIVAPYLTIVAPIMIYNFIETMDNVEGANAAGDVYSVREAQFADGICTMISACFGAVVPNTVWLGHAGLKKSGAGIGYSWLGGLILGLAGILGLFTFFTELIPPAIAAVTYVWCAVVMVAQGFKYCESKHYAAVGIAMVPPVADFLYNQITGAVGLSNQWTEKLASGIVGYNPEVTKSIIDSGVMWKGVAEVKSGAVIIAILLGTITCFIIDKRLDKVAITSLGAAVLSLFGFIHYASLGFYYKSPFVIGYVIIAVLAYILHLGRNKWCDAPDDFDYV
ncbi:MAG: xanthine/uracil/vitamin C permease, partial [Clostridium sp.]